MAEAVRETRPGASTGSRSDNPGCPWPRALRLWAVKLGGNGSRAEYRSRHGLIHVGTGVVARSAVAASSEHICGSLLSVAGVAARECRAIGAGACVDPATGRIEASRRLGAAFDQAIAAGGSLWVATSLTTSSASSSKQGLLRLNPRTLAIIGRWSDLGGGGSLALAGGGLWVAGRNRLSRLSLPEGKVTASVSLPGAASSDVAANAAGTILIVGEANKGGLGALERRDPKTGKFLASYRSIFSVGGPPWVGGVIGQGVWVHAASGMMGSVERFAATTLTLDRSTIIEGSNGITVLVANGLIWVSHAEVEGGPTRNFCGDPSDGRALAPLNIPPDSELLAVGAHNVYYASAPDDQERQNVNEEPIPDACRVR